MSKFVSQFDNPERIVSDHALVRWLERVCGLPMEEYRAHLAATVAPVANSGAVTYRTAEATYCFRHGVLTTVLLPGMRGEKSRDHHEAKRVREACQ